MQEEEQEFNLSKVLTVSAAHLTHDVFTAFLAPVLPLLINKFGLATQIVAAPLATSILMSLLGVAPSYPK